MDTDYSAAAHKCAADARARGHISRACVVGSACKLQIAGQSASNCSFAPRMALTCNDWPAPILSRSRCGGCGGGLIYLLRVGARDAWPGGKQACLKTSERCLKLRSQGLR